MGNASSNDETYKPKCRCKNVATYRCQSPEINPPVIVSNDFKIRYFSAYSYHHKVAVNKFVACYKCILPHHVRFFTEYPDGWDENIKYDTVYELIGS